MIRALTPLAVVFALCATAAADTVIIRNGSPPRPAGVISPPQLPTHGVPGSPSPTTPPTTLPRPARVAPPIYYGGYYGAYGYSPYWPVWYDTDPAGYAGAPYPGYGMGGYAAPAAYSAPVVNVPVQNTIVLPTPAPDLKARLTLNIPMRSRVWLGGKEVDAKASPLVLESPPLQEGQSYTFDVKIAWPEGDKTEERARSVIVGAGDQTSLTYQK